MYNMYDLELWIHTLLLEFFKTSCLDPDPNIIGVACSIYLVFLYISDISGLLLISYHLSGVLFNSTYAF